MTKISTKLWGKMPLIAEVSVAFRQFTIAFTALCQVSVVCAGDVAQKDSFEVITAAFGVYPHMANGPSFNTVDAIPFVPYQTNGWALIIRSQARQRLVYREELTLPTRPETWEFGKWPIHSVSDDGRTAVRQEEIAVDQGNNWLMTRWQIGYGDPKGTYEARVFLNGILVETRSIQVQ